MERKVHRGIQQVIFSTGATTSNRPGREACATSAQEQGGGPLK
jgi:hypothetical protein